MSETAVAFARLCLSGVETAVAFARSCSCGIETVIAFAGAGRAVTETAVTFARWYPCGIETAIAFAGAGRASVETAVAFAGAGRASTETVVAFAGAGRVSTETVVAFVDAKWVFLVHFSGAEVMPVSRLPCWGQAVVLVVSPSPPQCVLCAKKFAPRGLMVGVSAKKFALHAQNTPKLALCGVLGEFFRGSAAGGAVLGEFFRGPAVVGLVAGPFYWQC